MERVQETEIAEDGRTEIVFPFRMHETPDPISFIRFMGKACLLIIICFGTVSVAKTQSMRRMFILSTYAQPLYRDATKSELKNIAPDADLQVKYRDFLDDDNTGLTRLVADKGCSENPNVISAAEECLKYSMPGGGSSFSFRTKNYRLDRLADITYTNNSFQATGNFLHGIFVNIGDTPLKNVTIQIKELEFLVGYTPPTNLKNAKRANEIFSKGLIFKGLIHRRALYIQENTTFALRSIAFRGKQYRAVAGVTYNELDFDKRRDIIVVFRIVRKSDDDSITILWKILVEKTSPRLKP